MKRLKCWLLKRKLFWYVIKELGKEESEKIKEHINTCSNCRQYVAQMKKIVSIAEVKEKPFLNEVFWRKFDERMDLALAEQVMKKERSSMGMFLRPMPRLALATVVTLGMLLVFVYMPFKDKFKDRTIMQEKEIIETALLVEDQTKLYFNSDEDDYVEELLLQFELDDV